MGRSYGTPEVDEDDLAAELDALGDDLGMCTWSMWGKQYVLLGGVLVCECSIF